MTLDIIHHLLFNHFYAFLYLYELCLDLTALFCGLSTYSVKDKIDWLYTQLSMDNIEYQ